MRKQFRRKIYKAKKRFKKRPDTTPEYRAFRKAVIERDDAKCALCDFKSPRNEVHHIIKWADNNGSRYLTANGITLCHKCHQKIGGKENLWVRFFSQLVAQRQNEQRAADEASDFALKEDDNESNDECGPSE